MKTLPYLKHLTYASIVVTFPFIFSASKDTVEPAVLAKPIAKPAIKIEIAPAETVKTIRVTLDSLKKTSNILIKQI
ncbi:hypothetical protein [Pedobacter immunditicola]|uniref:hypothetical protein n=1 Tax=Pedobacter immunditicola TaxID=3133440 RepID=UPI0030AE3E8E